MNGKKEQVKPSGELRRYLIQRAQEVSPKKGFPRSERVYRTLSALFSRLQLHMQTLFGAATAFELAHNVPTPHRVIAVTLRVCQDDVTLLFPVDLMRTLAAMILKRPSSYLLTPPNAQEHTAFTFLIATLLAEEDLIPHQRVYLTSVSAEEKETSAAAFAVSCLFEGRKYFISVHLTEALKSRIEHYARLMKPAQRHVLRHLAVNCRIVAYLPLRSLAEISTFSAGGRLLLPGQLRGVLECLCPTCARTISPLDIDLWQRSIHFATG